jgi:hypothetical protein
MLLLLCAATALTLVRGLGPSALGAIDVQPRRALQAAGDAVLLAAAPAIVSVSGLICHLEANAEYSLQLSLLNAKPQYVKEDGAWHVYWTTNSGTVDAWVIDDDTDDTIVSAYLTSSVIVPPDGTARWMEFCDDDHDSHGGLGMPTLVTLDAPLSAANCAALATSTLRQPACENVPKGQCSPACALPWLDASALCDGKNAAAFDAIAPGASIACFATAAASSVLSETTIIIHVLEVHDFTFEAVSGTRYNVRVRVGEGSGASAVCSHNVADGPLIDGGYQGYCDNAISSGLRSCSVDFCEDCGQRGHYCDLACGVTCVEDGVASTGLSLLPPGLKNISKAVATDNFPTGDKDVEFTAAATGTYTAKVLAAVGSGPVTLTVTAIGTALERSPKLQTDGLPHQLDVNCELMTCGFAYDGSVAADGDGSGFNLVMPDAEAGRAYAFVIELPAGQTAAQVEATFYQAGAAAGAAGFEPVVSGPLGEWTATPAAQTCTANLADDPSIGGHAGFCDGYISSGQFTCAADFCSTCPHPTACGLSCGFLCDGQSYAEHWGCSNEDRSCISEIPDSFGIHPGGVFPRFIEGTWVAPASGPVLLRLAMNCDVVFYADVQAEGCSFEEDGSYACQPTRDGACIRGALGRGDCSNGQCTSELRLTVTQGAYFDQISENTEQAGHRRMQMSGDHLHHTIDTHAPTFGTVQRTDRIVIGRPDAETQAAVAWHAAHDAGRRLQSNSGSPHPPTLDEMLVAGTEANALLTTLFTVHEEPHVVYPLSMQLDDTDGTQHRRLQKQGDRLVVVIDTHAPTRLDADRAEQRLIDRLPGAGRGEPHGIGTCDLAARSQALNEECCDEPSEDCSSGRPANCNVGCAMVVLPFFDDCSGALGSSASGFDDVVVLCHAALGGQGRWRRVQTGGDHLHHTSDTHAVCGLGSTDAGCTAAGQTKRQTRLIIDRDGVEAQAAVLWRSEQADVGRRLQMEGDHLTHPIDTHAPSLDEMLVSGTPANALLSRLFIDEQQPQVAYPTGFALNVDGGKHRRLQMEGDRLTVTIDTHAATPAEAERIVQRLIPTTGTLALSDGGSTTDACGAALAGCVKARKASAGECLVCANKHTDVCTLVVLDAFCTAN